MILIAIQITGKIYKQEKFHKSKSKGAYCERTELPLQLRGNTTPNPSTQARQKNAEKCSTKQCNTEKLEFSAGEKE